MQLLLEHFALLALLVGNTAGSLAGRLAGSLAFAAATLLGRFCKISGFKSLNSFHVVHLLSKNDMNTNIVYQFRRVLSSKHSKNITPNQSEVTASTTVASSGRRDMGTAAGGRMAFSGLGSRCLAHL